MFRFIDRFWYFEMTNRGWVQNVIKCFFPLHYWVADVLSAITRKNASGRFRTIFYYTFDLWYVGAFKTRVLLFLSSFVVCIGIFKFAISLAVFYNFYNFARARPLLAIVVGCKNVMLIKSNNTNISRSVINRRRLKLRTPCIENRPERHAKCVRVHAATSLAPDVDSGSKMSEEQL